MGVLTLLVLFPPTLSFAVLHQLIKARSNSRYRVNQQFLCPEDNSRVRLKGGQDVGNTKLQQYGVQS